MAINLRDLALRFFNLRLSDKRAITTRLGLLTDEEIRDSSDFDLWQRAFMRARQLGLMEQLALAVDDAAARRE